MKKLLFFLWFSITSFTVFSTEQFVSSVPRKGFFPLIVNGIPCSIMMDSNEDKGVKMAIDNLQKDIFNVCGTKPEIIADTSKKTLYPNRNIQYSSYPTVDKYPKTAERGIEP